MGLITKLYDWTAPAGQVISSAEVTGEFAQIIALVNGGLDQANLAASAVGNTQLAANAVTDVKVAAGAAINATKIGGGTISNTEFGYLSGVTSNIQTQLNGKAGATVLTANRAVISDGSGVVTASPVTATEVSYLDGVTSSIQTQLNGKQATLGAGDVTSAMIDDGAVTPAKTSFMASNGASAAIYVGKRDGVSRHPTGFSESSVGSPATIMRITHNLGTSNYIVTATVLGSGSGDSIISVDTISANYFDVIHYAGGIRDLCFFSYILVVY